jgi:GAF domain-containing protein
MAETIEYSKSAARGVVYRELAPQIGSLVSGETDLVANLANVAAVLKEAFDFFWVGFYLVSDGQLVLGPFQGKLACTRIPFDNGVCGHAYTTRKTVIVGDVDAFPGHIACASESRSEIVVPILNADGDVVAVLDVDSDNYNDFSDADRAGLESIAAIIGNECVFAGRT